MKIETAIQQRKFSSEKEKALINILYTGSWISMHQVRFFKQFDISPQQYNVLRILRGQHPNAASVSLIQERMMDRMSNASRLVEKLKQRGFVKRSECPNDRRQVDVVITSAGLELLGHIDTKSIELHSSLDAINCEDAKILNQLLDKIKIKHND